MYMECLSNDIRFTSSCLFLIQIQYSTAVFKEFKCVSLLTNEAIERPKRKQN